MSDGIELDGYDYDSDEIDRGDGAKHAPIIKIALGSDGNFQAFLSLGETTKALSLPVVLATNHDDVPVSGPLTDTELRATAVPISVSSLPLPSGASTDSVSQSIRDHVKPPTSISNSLVNVTTAGTRVQLFGSATPCKAVMIQARDDNTGVAVVGGSSVIATQATRNGVALEAKDIAVIPIDDASKLYVDGTVNNTRVTVSVLA